LVRRAAGEFGAIEVVVGVGLDGRVTGVRIQRQREPRAIADAITSPAWLSAFKGKTSESPIVIGQDMPAVSMGANTSATVVADAVRALLVEFELSEGASKKVAPHHVLPGE
jgi:Na+-translocating ferredoxin:NAD+ oxidoreductase RnfG subunit